MYFEKTSNKRLKYGIELTQIRYIKDSPRFNIKAGQLGGYVSEKAYLQQNGNWFLSENAEVFGGYFYGGIFEGGNFQKGTFSGGTFKGGNFEGGNFRGGNFFGGTFWSGYFEGGNFKNGNFNGGYFVSGNFNGGSFRGGYYSGGNFDVGFGEVPCLFGGKYPVNFAGYTFKGDRMFACGCQVHEENKWTPEFCSTLAKEYKFTEQEKLIAEKMFEFVKEIVPKKSV